MNSGLLVSDWKYIIAGIVGVLIVATPLIMGLFSKNQFDVKGKTVLLTGASEGMGKSVAEQLAKKGANVMIVARNEEKLKLALIDMKAAAMDPETQKFSYMAADVTDPQSGTKMIQETTSWNGGESPDIVWCVAGASHPALFLEVPLEVSRHQMEINYWSCVYMAQAVLSQWLQPSQSRSIKGPSKGGASRHLIFTSSVAAFYTLAGYAHYSPAKAAIKGLSDTLAQELLLYDTDVQIHTVFPGTIQSPGLERENKTKPGVTFILEADDPVQTADEVARRSIAGLENGDYLVTVGFLGSLMRGTSWGAATRTNWVMDTLYTWLASIVCLFVGLDMNGRIRKYAKTNGHPSTYKKAGNA